MAMFNNLPGSNLKRINVQLVSLACGVAVATAVVISGSQVLRNGNNSGTTAPVTPLVSQPAGPVIDPTDFGSLGIEDALAQQARQTAAAATVEEARGLGQPGEGLTSVGATLIDPTDFGSLGIESALRPQYGTMADAAYASQPVTSRQAAVSVDAFLGLGQPGEGTTSVGATLIDPTDFGSMGVADTLSHSQATRFGTAADAVYAAESWQSRSSQAPLFGTVVDAVYVIESDIQLP
jgi:hypothetical protein